MHVLCAAAAVAIPALALLPAGPALADPVTWDYTVASCANGGNNECPIVGQVFAILTLQGSTETGQYTYETGFRGAPENTGTGALDFTLQMDFATLSPTENYCADQAQCLWDVAFSEQLPNAALGQYAFDFRDGSGDSILLSSNGSGRLSPNLDFGSLGPSCGIANTACVIEGGWAEASNSISDPSPDPVPEPPSAALILTAFGIMAGAYVLKARCRLRFIRHIRAPQ